MADAAAQTQAALWGNEVGFYDERIVQALDKYDELTGGVWSVELAAGSNTLASLGAGLAVFMAKIGRYKELADHFAAEVELDGTNGIALTFTMPDLTDITEAAFLTAIAAAGLFPGTRTTATDAIVVGNIVSHNPTEAATPLAGDTVAYVVSLGP